jgi:hypothetical protein
LYVELFALGCRAIFGPTVKSSFSQEICKTDFTAATTETSLSSSFFYKENDPLHFKGKPYCDLLKGAIMTNSKKLRLNSSHGLKLILIILALASCGYASSPGQSASRDWTRYPAVVEVNNPPGDIFAVSDPHGHIGGLVRVLTGAGLLEYRQSVPGGWIWKGGNAVLVVVGDLIDSKFQPNGSLPVITVLRQLQALAAREGGQVIVTMGNHEAEFLEDWNGDKTAKFRDELAASAIQQKNDDLKPDRVANCQGDLGQWLCQLPIAARVREWFFAHAGYTKNRDIPTINSDIANDFKLNGFKAKQLVGKQSILEAGLDETGPGNKPWVFVGQPGTTPENLLNQYTKTLGVRHIVQGHKPGKVDFKNGLERPRGEMFQAYGLLFLIDGDMNTHLDSGDDDNYGAALRIRRTSTAMANDTTPQPYCISTTTQAIAIKKGGSQKTLWEETERKTSSGEPCR